ncbi:MAG: DUF5610 domain-containing protein [Planctomycetota bacterium]
MIQAIDPALFLPPESLKSGSQGHDVSPRQASTPPEKGEAGPTLLDLTLRTDRVEFSAQGQDAFLKGYRESMHVDATVRLGDSLWDISIDVQREVIMQGAATTPQEFQKGLLDSLPEDVRQKIEGYLAQGENGTLGDLSPDRVSDNIVNFALTGFDPAQGFDSKAKQGFLDYILPAIDKGFKDALDILDAFLTPEARGIVDETRKLVGEKLDTWKGIDITA